MPLDEIYTKVDVQELPQPDKSKALVQGLKQQLKVLKYRRKKQLKALGQADLSTEKLIRTVEQLLLNEGRLKDEFEAYQIKGKDGLGNVYFTGYFTPILKVSKHKTATYRYPLYAYPHGWNGKLPTRGAIDRDSSVLAGRGLELAYAENPIDIYFMQVQGSGVVEFTDGSREMFAYAGSNGHPYRSIGRYMIKHGYTNEQGVSIKKIRKFFLEHPELLDEILPINRSYVFFKPSHFKQTPKGAGNVPLTTNYSIAVDTRYIPMGSCMLAAVPIIDRNNKVMRHEYRVLLAQDIGGAIKGPGHVDLYTGVGERGRRHASALHHYGKLWLLLPNEADAGHLTASL